MSIKDNYKNPHGFVGKIALNLMNLKGKDIAEYGFSYLESGHVLKALDIGCGGGKNISRLLQKYHNATIYGIDISPLAVKKSIAFNKDSEKRINIVEGDALKLPFEDDFFDLVTAFDTVYYFKDIALYFKEVYRVLKPSGKFSVICQLTDPNKSFGKNVDGFNVYSRDQLQALLRSAGFKDIEVNFNRKHYICATGGK